MSNPTIKNLAEVEATPSPRRSSRIATRRPSNSETSSTPKTPKTVTTRRRSATETTTDGN